MKSLQEAFDALINERNEINRKFQSVAQDLFKETTKEFFDKVPSVTAIVWTQYTPYFNDGETCVFGVNDPYFTNANDSQLSDITRWGEYEGEEEGVWSENDYILVGDSQYCVTARSERGINLTQQEIKAIADLSRLIQSSEMEEVMEAMFGDHVRVVATRSGFDVEECDHD